MQTQKPEYSTSDEDYVEYIGNHTPKLWALRDYPCEPNLLSKHNRTIEEHQDKTLNRHIDLLNLVDTYQTPGQPLAVLQGWEPADYIEHIDLLKEHGCLTDYVGIGSVCRRYDTEAIAEVILTIRDALPARVDLHAFGVKNSVLQYEEVVNALRSADSSAYDFAASQYGERIDDRFSYRDSLWSWLNWRRKLYSQIGSKTLSGSAKSINKGKSQESSQVDLTTRDQVWTAVLEFLRSANQRFTLNDVLEYAGIPDSRKETARKALHSMSSSGWVSHEPHSLYWYPGPKASAELQG